MSRGRRRRDLADRLDELESRTDERGRGVVAVVSGHGTGAVDPDALDDRDAFDCPDCHDDCIMCLELVDR